MNYTFIARHSKMRNTQIFTTGFSRILLCYTICLCLYSCRCGIPVWYNKTRFVEAESTIKFPNEQSDIGEKINLNGFFYNNTLGHLVNEHFFFYEDGSVLVSNGWIDGHFAQDSLDYEKKKGIERGLFTVSNDTMTVNLYSRQALFKKWIFSTYKFLIADKDTLRLLSAKERVDCETVSYAPPCNIYVFRSGKKPLPNTYLKRCKWLWKDENKWKEWMLKKGYRI